MAKRADEREPADKRIRQMMNFIILEAQEKAQEIEMKSNEEYQIEKGKILNPERVKLTQEYARKVKDLEVKRRIELSTQVNESRLQVLKAREEMMKQLSDSSFSALSSLRGADYTDLMRKLILQGLIRIDEAEVVVYAVKADLKAAKDAAPKAARQFEKAWAKVLPDAPPKVKVSVSSEPLAEEYIGGVLLKARAGKIILDNSLRSRMKVALEALLPQVRGKLFGITPHVGVVYEDEEE